MVENRKRQFRIRRRYLVPSFTFQWFEKAVAQIKLICDPIDYFSGSCVVKKDFRGEIDTENLEDWVDCVQKHWLGIATSHAYFSSDQCKLVFRCDYENSTTDLDIESTSIEDGNEIITKLEEDLLLAQIEEVKKRYAVRMRFFTSVPLTLQWFKQAVSYLTSTWVPLIDFDGGYHSRDYFYGDSIKVETLEEWISHLQQKWSEVTESNFWLRTPSLDLSFRCEHQRSLIDLEVHSRSIEESDSVLNEIKKHLKLLKIEAVPYRYRKSAAMFKIEDWNKKIFVDATRDLFGELFQGQEPIVRDGFATKVFNDKFEKLTDFSNYHKYLKFIESDDNEFERANLVVEGPNGLALGINLNKKDKLIEFRSSVPKHELKEKITNYYKPLSLDPVDIESSGSAIASTSQLKVEKWWAKYAIQIILVAIFGTAAIYVQLAKSYFTEYTLEITKPSQSPVEVDSAEVSLDWYLWPKDSFLHGADYQAPTSIILVHQGVTVGEFYNIVPPFTIQLENGEGEYLVELRPQSKAQPLRIVIIYKTQSTDSEQVPP